MNAESDTRIDKRMMDTDLLVPVTIGAVEEIDPSYVTTASHHRIKSEGFSRMSLSDQLTIRNYNNRIIATALACEWDWFISLNHKKQNLPLDHVIRDLDRYINAVGGMTKGSGFSYLLMVCKHESAANPYKTTPDHIQGVITANGVTKKMLRMAWRSLPQKRTRISDGKVVVEWKRAPLGRVYLDPFNPTLNGLSYSVNQNVGFFRTNVPAIKQLQQQERELCS